MRDAFLLILGIIVTAAPIGAKEPAKRTAKRSPISTHVLDTARGQPAEGIAVVLAVRTAAGSWRTLARGTTDADGRISKLLAADQPIERGVYRLTFDVAPYFAARKQEAFYPEISIVFEIRAPAEHYHVPLLLNPFGYSTYRGS